MGFDDGLGLLFKIRSDSSQAQSDIKNLRQAYDKEVKAIKQSGEDAFLSFGKAVGLTTKDLAELKSLAPGVGAAIGVITGAAITGAAAIIGVGVAIFSIAKQAADAGSKLQNFSERLHFTVEDVATLALASEQSNTSIETTANAIGFFEKKLGQAALGSKEAIKDFEAIGIKGKELAGAIENPAQAFRILLAILQKIPDDARKNAVANAFLGKSADQLSNLLIELGGDFDNYQNNLRRTGNLTDEVTAKQADAFDTAYTRMNQDVRGTINTLGGEFMPVVTRVMTDTSDLLERNRGMWDEWAKSAASALDRFIDRLSDPKFQDYLAQITGSPGLNADFSGAINQKRGRAGTNAGVGADQTRIKEDTRPGGLGLIRQQDELRERGTGPGISTLFSGKAKGAGKDPNAERIRTLERQEKEVERIYKQEVDAANRAYKLLQTNLEDHTAAMIEAEQKRYAAKVAIINQELALAKKESDREKFNDDLKAALDEKNNNIQKINDEAQQKEADSLRDHLESLLKLAEDYDERSIEAARSMAETGATTYEQAEQKVLDIQTKAFDRRLEILAAQERQLFENVGVVFDEAGNMVAGIENAAKVNAQEYLKINDDITRVTEAQVRTQEDAARRIGDAVLKDTANLLKITDALDDVEERIKATERETTRIHLEQMARAGVNFNFIIASQLQLDLADIEAEHKRIQRQYDGEEKSLLATAKTEAERLAIEQSYNDLRLAENRRYWDQRIAADKAAAQEVLQRQNTGFFSGEERSVRDPQTGEIQQNATTGQRALAGLNSALKESKQIAKETFGAFAQAVGQTVENFVLLGTSGPNAMRKLTAQVLASLAAQATVKAVMALADGFVNLFVNPGQSAADFTAAALYGSIALGSIVVGRATAGNLFQQPNAQGQGAGAGYNAGTGTQTTPQPVVREEYRGPAFQPQQPLVQHHIYEVRTIHEVRAQDGFVVKELEKHSHDTRVENIIVEHIKRNIHKNGYVRNKIMDLASFA